MTLRYYVQALWFTTVVEAGVRCVSVRRLASWLGVATAPHESQATAPCASVEDAVRAADRVLALWPAKGLCVRRSLVLGAMLKGHGPVLRIGVKRISKRITAHAWVEIGGSPVGEQRASEFYVLS